MKTAQSPTVVHAFLSTLTARPSQPLITFYDDATGERTELSAATLANWVAKTANLLRDGLDLGPGEIAAVRLPSHWQTAGVLLGCWVAGLTVDTSGDPGAVAFVAEPEPIPTAPDVYALALAPLGQPFRAGPPPGTQDYVLEVRQYGDHLPPLATSTGQLAFVDGTRHADLLTTEVDAPRVLIDGDEHPDPRQWLVAPLVAEASIVLCRHLDPTRLADRLATERATPYPPHHRGDRGLVVVS